MRKFTVHCFTADNTPFTLTIEAETREHAYNRALRMVDARCIDKVTP